MAQELDFAGSQQGLIQGLATQNLLINGFHAINQQNVNNAISSGTDSTYFSDQWSTWSKGSWAGTYQQVASPFPSQPDITTGTKISITTGAALAAGDYVGFYQPLEGVNLNRLSYGTSLARPVSIGFFARSSIALTGYLALRILNSSNVAIRTFLRRFVLTANTDTFIPIPTIPGDPATALILSNAASMQVSWNFGTGSTYQGTADSWQSGNFLAGSDVTNLAATAGNSVVVSGCYMLPGIVTIGQNNLSLLARPLDQELLRCQRYWNKTGDSDYSFAGQYAQNVGNPQGYQGAIYIGQSDGTGFYSAMWFYPTEMRSTPSIGVINANSAASGSGYSNQSGNSYTANAVYSGRRNCTLIGQGAAAGNNFIFHAAANARM